MMAYERYQAGLAPGDLKVQDCGASDDNVDGEGAAPSTPPASGSNAASDEADEGVSLTSASGGDEGGNSGGIALSGERSVKKPNTAATVASITAEFEGYTTPARNPVEPEALLQAGNGDNLSRKDASVAEVGGTVAGVGGVEPENSGSGVKSGGDESRGGAGGVRSVDIGNDRPRVQDEGDTLAWRTYGGDEEEKKRESVEVRGKKRAIDEASV